jgi:hypothetical protein
MTEREFVFWLRGYICHPKITTSNKEQLILIKEYLNRLAQGKHCD